jgi:hypothetical protein
MTQQTLLAVLLLATRHLAAGSEPAPACLLQVQKNLPTDRVSLTEIHSTEEEKQPEPQQDTEPPALKYGPHVCIVARSCGPESSCAPAPGDPKRIVRAFLSSMIAQTYQSWELHLLNGQGGEDIFQSLLTELGDERLVSGPNAPKAFESNTWGYEATNHALNELLQAGTKNPCAYFLFTNADNLYARTFLETGMPAMAQNRDLIGFNFVTRYVQGEAWKPWTNRAMLPMHEPGFTEGHIDLGAVLVSAAAMKETGVRFNPANGALADWRFFAAIIQRAGSKGTAFNDELQYIHQLEYSSEVHAKSSHKRH